MYYSGPQKCIGDGYDLINQCVGEEELKLQHNHTSQHNTAGKHNSTVQHNATGEHNTTGQHSATGQYNSTGQHNATGEHNTANQLLKYLKATKIVKKFTQRNTLYLALFIIINICLYSKYYYNLHFLYKPRNTIFK